MNDTEAKLWLNLPPSARLSAKERARAEYIKRHSPAWMKERALAIAQQFGDRRRKPLGKQRSEIV